VYGIKFPGTKVIYYYQSLYDISGTGLMNVRTAVAEASGRVHREKLFYDDKTTGQVAW
jgi:hypothetical protein